MKKHKKLFKLIIILSVVVLLIGGGVLFYYKDVWFNKPQGSELGTMYGEFGFAPIVGQETLFINYSDRFTQFQAEIDAGMAANATAEEKALAAYIIYRIGCLANETSPMYAKYSIGKGKATGKVDDRGNVIDVSGEMKVTASYYNLRYPFTKPSSVDQVYTNAYNIYTASEEYTQIPKDGVTGSDEKIVKGAEPALRSTLPFGRKTIITLDKKVVWNAKTSTCVITPENATAEFSENKRDYVSKSLSAVKEEEIAKNLVRNYSEDWGDLYGLTAHDVSIHIINPYTILGDTVVIEKLKGKDLKNKVKYYYSVTFEVDTVTNRGTEQSATYYSEQIYKAQAPEVFIKFLEGYYLTYSYLNIRMSIYENGYFRTFGSDEVWAMGGEIKGLGKITASITSNNEALEVYCYDYDTIMQGYVNRYFGNKEYVNLPMEALPFYESDLKNFTPEEYGEYR